MTIRLVVVDDDPFVRSGLRGVLSVEPGIEVVGEAASGAEAVSVSRTLEPDVLLMDVRMPLLDGISATRVIAARGLRPRILILTTFEEDDLIADALAAGASGYLLKRAQPEVLIHAIRTVHAGDALVYPERIRAILANRQSGRDPQAQLAIGRLTAREKEILLLLTEGCSNADIADRLVLSVQTVKSHVATVLRKLEIRDRTQAVAVAFRSGLAR